MAKINDTTTYPNTPPALGDHVPGTDVSNTGNDANGETVTFTLQALLDLFEANGAAPASFLASGTLADARVAESNVTQHQAALSITESQISDLGSYLTDVVGDTTPQLGGNLDVNSNSIVSTANGDITIAPNGTGNVVLGNYTLDADATVGAGQDGYVLKYTHSNGTWAPAVDSGAGGGISNVVEDTTPQLGGNLDLNTNGITFPGATVTDVTGSDTLIVSGTAGTSGDLAVWNVDGDLVDGPTPPSGTIVGTTDTQTLSGKTIAGGTAAATTNTITIKLDSAADWTSNNPTLAAGEFGYESDTGKMKLGDGATAWTSLGYWVTSLANPSGADKILIWDDSETTQEWGDIGTGLTYSGTALAVDIGTTVQGYDAGLASIAGLTTAADQMIYTTASDTYAVTSLTAFARTVLDDADAGTARTTLGAAALGANVFTGTQDFNGQQVEGFANKVVTSVTGTLTMADHSGNILKTSGNITVPTTAGFNAVIIAGGAHTVTFNSTTSAAMATGDVMTVVVESGTVIHAVLTAAADKVSFT